MSRNSNTGLTVEKLLEVLEAERRTYCSQFVPLHPKKLALIRKSVELIAQKYDSIRKRRNSAKTRAHIILTDLWTLNKETFVLCSSRFFPTQLGSLKSENYLQKVQEWWNDEGLVHPIGLEETLRQLDVLKVLQEAPDMQGESPAFPCSGGPQIPSINTSSSYITGCQDNTPIHGPRSSRSHSRTTVQLTGGDLKDRADQDPEGVQQCDTQQIFYPIAASSSIATHPVTHNIAWMGGIDSLAQPLQLDSCVQVALAPERVFAFLSRRFAKHDVKLCSNPDTSAYIEIKQQEPFGLMTNTRIFLDWETSNDLIWDLKTVVP
ncbi:hypothetical protein WAI453_012671 [Rhynchosporium graminicola]